MPFVYCATVLIYIVGPLFSGARFVDEINILFDLCQIWATFFRDVYGSLCETCDDIRWMHYMHSDECGMVSD